ncbi:STAS domain-containing protein [uncultured Hymenobacter sp.]|uniref:STAS domain-containing protein n=1 Tax=uncultured Hymenobacter sp. TaxID=170016 RepID=UPI0035CB9539
MAANFTAYIQRTQSRTGVSLRGECTDLGAAQYLEAAIDEVITNGRAVVWIDCQRLESITWQGQRAILNADYRARAMGMVLQWCGMPKEVVEQLVASGLSLLLHLQPANGYRGPQQLLHDTLPISTKLQFPPNA